PVKTAARLVLSWKNSKKDFHGRVFVAKNSDGRIMGLAVGHLLDAREHPEKIIGLIGGGKTYFLREIAIRPQFRRNGVGSMLTQARLEHAQSLGCASVVSYTRQDNLPQIRLFEKKGFEKIAAHRMQQLGRRSNFVYYQKMLR
ncbi:GNAT family N-acetyltransferase, partial [Candidatus Micrarchaeota archaeon]|nr:GNAT family N-acetyltransferase [Candidatus Micrarchaeota archaeon]